jgi:hypothetical protein
MLKWSEAISQLSKEVRSAYNGTDEAEEATPRGRFYNHPLVRRARSTCTECMAGATAVCRSGRFLTV